MLLGFLLGLLTGVLGLLWQRLRTRAQFTRLLNEISPSGSVSSLSLSSQLLAAIANQHAYLQVLQSRIQRYQFMLTSAPIAFLHVDDENRLLWCNPLAQKLFSIPQSQYPEPRLLLEIVRSYELDQLIERVRQSGHPQDQEWTFYPLNTNPARVLKQQSYALRGFGIPLFDKQVGIFIENRQDVALLRQQRDRWTSDVAHELKTPLTSIRLIAETLQPRLEPGLIKWADRLITQSTRLSNLVQDLLDLSQLEGEHQESMPFVQAESTAIINLPQLIKAVWNSLEPISCKKRLQIQYTGPETCQMMGDESRLYRVITNLLDNSIKYSPVGEVIQINVNLIHADQMIQIKVIDAGPGFLEDDLPHIFERFYRADPSRSRIDVAHPSSMVTNDRELQRPTHASTGIELDPTMLTARESLFPHTQSSAGDVHKSYVTPGGTGLGLAIVRQIIEAHGGEIEARNRSSQAGAVICIRLPVGGA